jgi:hypothetical protein
VIARAAWPIVVFVDKIDATLSLPILVRRLFHRGARAASPAPRARRGRAANILPPRRGRARDLVEDLTRTTLNVGRVILLEDFSREEVAALLDGFAMPLTILRTRPLVTFPPPAFEESLC